MSANEIAPIKRVQKTNAVKILEPACTTITFLALAVLQESQELFWMDWAGRNI
jgi:hypothetical protein